MSRIWSNGRQVGKRLLAEQLKDDALSRGKTVVEVKDDKATSRRRVFRKGRSLDVIKDLKTNGGTFMSVGAFGQALANVEQVFIDEAIEHGERLIEALDKKNPEAVRPRGFR